MTDQHDEVAGSDPVTAVQQWLTERGLPVPEPEPAVEAVMTQHLQPGSGRTASSAAEVDGTREPATAGGGGGSRHGSGRQSKRGTRSNRGSGSDQRPGRRSPASADGELANPEETARGVVLRKLTGQARTRHELDKALKVKEVPESVANVVLDRMEEIGLVDDAAFARDWVEDRQQRRQLSRRALRHELQVKGVDRDHIEAALTSVDADDEYVAALALAQRKSRTMTALPRDVRYRRLAGALARRGFSGGVVGQVISQVLDDDTDH